MQCISANTAAANTLARSPQSIVAAMTKTIATAAMTRGGWQGSTRLQTLPRNWRAIRQQVLARAGYQCQHVRYDTGKRCTARANQCDHIGERNNHTLDNLQALCEYHHQRKSSSQGGRANARNHAADPVKHAGLL